MSCNSIFLSIKHANVWELTVNFIFMSRIDSASFIFMKTVDSDDDDVELFYSMLMLDAGE